MSTKNIRGKRWTVQFYWPTLHTHRHTFGIQMPSALLYREYGDGARAVGIELLGFGFGVLKEPNRGVAASEKGLKR
jgi:hypothetical protein